MTVDSRDPANDGASEAPAPNPAHTDDTNVNAISSNAFHDDPQRSCSLLKFFSCSDITSSTEGRDNGSLFNYRTLLMIGILLISVSCHTWWVSARLLTIQHVKNRIMSDMNFLGISSGIAHIYTFGNDDGWLLWYCHFIEIIRLPLNTAMAFTTLSAALIKVHTFRKFQAENSNSKGQEVINRSFTIWTTIFVVLMLINIGGYIYMAYLRHVYVPQSTFMDWIFPKLRSIYKQTPSSWRIIAMSELLYRYAFQN